MDLEHLLDEDLVAVAERIRRREVSPVALTDAALARIARLEPALCAFVRVMDAEARTTARALASELEAGHVRGPLHGIPIGIKDICDCAGVPTTAGSGLRRAHVAATDATVVRKLRAAGAVIIGKLTLHEFAFGATGINPHTGTARNPWDRERIAGGSSSGSGVAVAAGECFAAIGTDTGGSIRMPAALCGVVGLKPTHGRVSAAGVFPMAPSHDHIGPFARSVRDVAQLLGVIAGHDPEDPWGAEVPVEDFAAQLDAGVRPLRFGIPNAWVFDDCDREVVAAVEGATAVLAGLGARRVEVNGGALGDWWIANITIILGEAAAIHRDQFLTDPAGFGTDVRVVLAAAMELRAHEYVRAAELRQALRHGAAEERLFGAADVLLMPATPTAARRIADLGPDDMAGDLSRNTGPFNLSGHPALSVPCGRTAAGLPIGLQMVGRHWDESTLIRAAAAYERARGPWPMPPIAHPDIGA